MAEDRTLDPTDSDSMSKHDNGSNGSDSSSTEYRPMYNKNGILHVYVCCLCY